MPVKKEEPEPRHPDQLLSDLADGKKSGLVMVIFKLNGLRCF